MRFPSFIFEHPRTLLSFPRHIYRLARLRHRRRMDIEPARIHSRFLWLSRSGSAGVQTKAHPRSWDAHVNPIKPLFRVSGFAIRYYR